MGKHNMTVKDIARMAGVSVATVSRVMNRNGRFSTETEKRVRAAIKDCGYQPNQLAKGLRQSKTDAIGIIVPNIANEFFSSMILAMQAEFFSSGYAAVIYNTNNSLDMERQCHAQLAAQSVAGIVSVNSLEDIRDAISRIVPTVYIDRFIEDRDLSGNVASIASDNVRGGSLAAQELFESGCCKPVTITALAKSPVTKLRSQGFCTRAGELGIKLEETQAIAPKSTTFEEGRRIVKELIVSGVEFDGMFCHTDWLAMGALEALRELHVRVPDEVRVVGHDDIMIARFGRPPLTTVHQDSLQIGTRAAKMIIDMTRGVSLKEPRLLIPVGLVRRESTRNDGR